MTTTWKPTTILFALLFVTMSDAFAHFPYFVQFAQATQRKRAARPPSTVVVPSPLETKPAMVDAVCDSFRNCRSSFVAWSAPAGLTMTVVTVDQQEKEVTVPGMEPLTVPEGRAGRDWFAQVWGKPDWLQPLLPSTAEFRGKFTGVDTFTVSALVDDPPADVRVEADGRVFVGVFNPRPVVAFNGMRAPVDGEGYATPPAPWSRGPAIDVTVCRSSLPSVVQAGGSGQSVWPVWPDSRCRVAVSDIPLLGN